MTFLTNPVVVVVLVALILGGGLFVVSRWGTPGSGTGGVTGGSRPKPDPYGTMRPKGTGTGTTQPPKPPSDQV